MSSENETPEAVRDAVRRVDAHLDSLGARFVARRAVLELIMLGLVAREHVLLIGPPGTGKSAVVQALAAAFDARSFEYLIGRFTEPSELFGGLDLNALKDGQVKPVTAGMLPEAEIAFLDEIFLGSTAILNSLLKILNERTYRRGQFGMRTPLITCVAASNALPTDPSLAAFADRFLATMFVEPVEDEQLVALFRAGWEAAAPQAVLPPLEKTMVEALQAAALAIDLEPIHPIYAHVVRKIRLTGAVLSDRKIVKAQKLIAAAAVLRGAAAAGPEDLWPITFLVQDKDRQGEIRELLQAELRQSLNPVLSHSVAQATSGPTAHAAHLGEQARALIEARPVTDQDDLRETWLVRLETLLTRIDAAFDQASMPQHLRAARAEIEGLLEAGGAARAAPPTSATVSPDLVAGPA